MNFLVFGYGFIAGMSLVMLVFSALILPKIEANSAYIEKQKEIIR
jgi:hypothetical protein